MTKKIIKIFLYFIGWIVIVAFAETLVICEFQRLISGHQEIFIQTGHTFILSFLNVLLFFLLVKKYDKSNLLSEETE